jgi:hypothetical protein
MLAWYQNNAVLEGHTFATGEHNCYVNLILNRMVASVVR